MIPESEIMALDRFIDSPESDPTPAIDGLAETVRELRRAAERTWPDADFPMRAAARIAAAVRATTGDQTDRRSDEPPPPPVNDRALTILAAPPATPSAKRHWLKEFGQIAAAVLALALVAGLLAALFQDRNKQAGIVQNGVAGPHQNGAIIFTSSRSGNDDISVINPDGTGLRQLTNDPEMDFGAIWSPDGTKIAFMRMKAIPETAIPPGALPLISIYVMNADGSDQRNLTPGGSRSFRNLVWSPDGKQLVVECSEKPTDRAGNGQICVLNIDGTGMHRVVPPQLFGTTPSWSPDGRWIAFRGQASSMDQPAIGIYLVSPDGSRQRTVLSAADFPGILTWSPDSRQIAYTHGQQSPTLTVVDIDTSRTRNLETGGRLPSDPVWSPDGSRLLFLWQASDRASVGVGVVNADGTAFRDFSATADQIISAAWSPDGQAIAVVQESLNLGQASPSTASIPVQLGVFYLDGSPSQILVDAEGHGLLDSPPSWQPIH
jgi:Tol biopolymer transport system component